MTRDEIINLAISAGFHFFDAGRASMLHTTKAHYPEEYFERFAALIAAAERAKLCALPGAQPAPSVPDGWLRAIDEALVTAHIGGANAHDTYEQAKAMLDNLIEFHVDVATDPAVNGGWKLVPIEPTPEMLCALIDGANQYDSWKEGYRDMLKAAPEAKP